MYQLNSKTMKKALSLILMTSLLVSIMVSLSSCQNRDGSTNDTLNVSVTDEPVTLDPAFNLPGQVHSLISHVFEGLINIDGEGSFYPGVAEKWETNEDNTVFTFTLRDNSFWSDGTKVTAGDFKFSWLRVLNPESASPWASFLYYIKNAEKYNQGELDENQVGIEARDDRTLIVTLERPTPYFLNVVVLQPYYPVNRTIIIERGDAWAQNVDSMITNGAFLITEWNRLVNIKLIRSDTYWDKDNVYLQNIIFLLYSDSTTIMNAYDIGELDFVASTLTVDEMEQIDKVKFANLITTRIIVFNNEREVFQDIRLREAISIAIDRNEFAILAGNGNYPLISLVPHGSFNLDDSDAAIYLNETSNIEHARSLLKEAGFENGEGIPALTYLTNTDEINVRNAEIFQSQMRKIGINIEINSFERGVMIPQRFAGNYDLTPMNFSLGNYPDISGLLLAFTSNDMSNYPRLRNNYYDELYSRILIESDAALRSTMIHEMKDILVSQYVVIPLFYSMEPYIARDNLSGYIYSPSDFVSLKQARLD